MSLEQLDIVLLNFRNAALTIETAQITRDRAPGAAIYVVDNGSEDGSFEKLRAALPFATVVANEQNVGFGGGMNRGIREGKRPFVIVQANDTRPAPGAYQLMVERCLADPRIGAVAPDAAEPDGRVLPHFRREPGPLKIVASLLPGAWRLQQSPAGGDGPIEWIVSFAATLFRREAIEGIGAFDSNYFLGWEEWDVSRRLRDKGWKMAHLPEAKVVHASAANEEQNPRPWRLRHNRRAMVHHLRKHHGSTWYRAGQLANAVTEVWMKLSARGRAP